MPAGRGLLGREITLTVGGSTILGVVTKDISFTNSAVDVTDDQSSGYRELLATGGLKQLDLSLSGTIKNYALLRTMFETSQMMACVIQLGDGATTRSSLTFDALLTDLQFGGDSNDRVEFSANLQSSGTVAFVAGT